MTTRTPECKCLHCGAAFSAATPVDGKGAPEPGIPTVCLKCGAVMVFADDLTVRGFTKEEADEVLRDPMLMAILERVVRGVHIVRAGKN